MLRLSTPRKGHLRILSILILWACLSIGASPYLFAYKVPQDTLERESDSLKKMQPLDIDETIARIIKRSDSLLERGHPSQAGETHEIKIKLSENRLTIENLGKDGVLEVYNIMGSKVYSRRVKAGISTHILSLPKGYYIIKIGKYTRKIALK